MVSINNEPIWEPNREEFLLKPLNNLYLPLIWGIIMPLTISTFIVSLIDERRNHVDSLQRISGATDIHVCLSNLIWDYGIFELMIILYILFMSPYIMAEFLGISKLSE